MSLKPPVFAPMGLGLSIIMISCASTFLDPKADTSGYDLSKPDAIFILPDTLHEISGLTDIDENTVACVQDENGVLFFYDLANSRVAHQYPFHLDGDYEGITRVGDPMYFLRSDGTLFQKEDYKVPDPELRTFVTAPDSTAVFL